MMLVVSAFVLWAGLWALNIILARRLSEQHARIAVPVIFGLTLVLVSN